MINVPSSEILKEFMDLSKIEPKKKESYGKFFSRLIRGVNEIDEEVFETMSSTSQDYYDKCIHAMNNKVDMPDLPDVKEDGGEGETKDAANGKDTSETSAPGEEDADADTDDTETEDKADADTDDAKSEDGVKAAEDKPTKKKSKGKGKAKTKGRDKFGLLIGSLSSKAASMFEETAKMKEVKEETGNTHYNLFKKLRAAGHTIEKSEGNITLIHKDDA